MCGPIKTTHTDVDLTGLGHEVIDSSGMIHNIALIDNSMFI